MDILLPEVDDEANEDDYDTAQGRDDPGHPVIASASSQGALYYSGVGEFNEVAAVRTRILRWAAET